MRWFRRSVERVKLIVLLSGLGIERLVRKAMHEVNPTDRMNQLKWLADELGCDYMRPSHDMRETTEEELVREIRMTGMSRRGESIWLVALLSMVISVVSAAAAWIAVLSS